MKIFVDVNGAQIERELSSPELLEAWVEQQHLFDVEYIEGMFGMDERFDEMNAEEKSVALHDIAWRYSGKISGMDDPDKFEVASDAVEDYFEELYKNRGVEKKGRYEIAVTIDVVGCPCEALEQGFKMQGDGLEKLKADSLLEVQKLCAAHGFVDNQIVVGILIEMDGEWLDSEEATLDLSELNVWVCSYKDSLGYLDNDNVTDILVPKAWLIEQLIDEGQIVDAGEFEEWLDEFTADNTDMIARDAVAEGLVLSCADKRISCVLGLGESYMQTNDYGKRLAEHMREIYRAEYDRGLYQNEGTNIIPDDKVSSVEDAAGWCLLTYGDRALQEVQEWVDEKDMSVYGFYVEEVLCVLENCMEPVKENSLDARLGDASLRSDTTLGQELSSKGQGKGSPEATF